MARKSKQPPASAAPPTIVLKPLLDIRETSALHAELLGARNQDIVLDFGAVQRVGGQCLQVLLAARTTWHADGHRLSVVNLSDGMAETLAMLGVAQDDLSCGPEMVG